MKCRNCGSENLEVMTTAIISLPIKYWHRMSKKAFRDKDVQLWGIMWDKADFICKDCGYTLIRDDKKD